MQIHVDYCNRLKARTNLGRGEIDDCNRCKVLSDSFKNWLQKTARGKYEGGDTAWEEAKLKSYSRSEMRLVEIQEGLCSEVKKHKDRCYGLAEEVEHLLEQWWVHEDPNSQDLFTWLCVSTLQYCCPQNHYGPLCTACPVDENNKICGEKGSCDGDGTRKGNGSCICNRGFAGEFCENCAENYYSTPEADCKPCHKACNNCKGEGAAACVICQTGWELEVDVCTDVNECLKENLCKVNEYCINWEGSYSCKTCDVTCKTCSGKGITNCTSCEVDEILVNGMCLDETLKHQYLLSTMKRLALYALLLLVASEGSYEIVNIKCAKQSSDFSGKKLGILL
ncbi:Cysteine-rich with EGF-like domain protein 2 [Papilio machaon]|uniref:Cysteine-rich with EGF-like domain protein 2 n=1 Tax=Papilio machaon TaxID=76193 RepID=A0A194QT94_PAPMA|nr:Cysteine-rich with EGF-like domain protein 2 [Papilio machaon]